MGTPRNAPGKMCLGVALWLATMVGTEQTIPTIIDDLYAGTLDRTAWDRAMVSIADLVSGVCSCLFAFRPTDGVVLRDEVCRFDPTAMHQYRQVWVNKDPRLALSMPWAVGEGVYENKLMPTRVWQNSEIYNDFLLGADTPWFLNFWLHKTPDKIVSLSLQGSQRRGAFGEEDAERIKPLIPHVRRTLEIRDRLEMSYVRAETLSQSLSSVSFGVVILDSTARVLESNTVAENLFQIEPGVTCSSDRVLRLGNPAGAQLDQWIGTGRPPSDCHDGLLKVKRARGSAISVLVTAIPLTATSWLGGDPRWVLLLFDPDRRIHVSTKMIARDLGISGREAEIAALLVAGYDLKTIALRLSISSNTVRTHVKVIFSKTGIRSQAELVRRVSSGPALIV
jgi:DNA-binding CsgD family transcriptional regulator